MTMQRCNHLATIPQTYWRVLKKRLLSEGNETVTNCNVLLQGGNSKRFHRLFILTQQIMKDYLDILIEQADGMMYYGFFRLLPVIYWNMV